MGVLYRARLCEITTIFLTRRHPEPTRNPQSATWRAAFWGSPHAVTGCRLLRGADHPDGEMLWLAHATTSARIRLEADWKLCQTDGVEW